MKITTLTLALAMFLTLPGCNSLTSLRHATGFLTYEEQAARRDAKRAAKLDAERAERAALRKTNPKLAQIKDSADMLGAIRSEFGSRASAGFYLGLELRSANPANLVVEEALRVGADPNARDNKGRTPFHYAARVTRLFGVIATLVDFGADPNARDEDGDTPLHKSAYGTETPAVITALVNVGADINARDKNGFTPLHRAAWENPNPAVITALLDAGANIEAQATSYNFTPLHTAAYGTKNPAVINVLLDAGADIKAIGAGMFPIGHAGKNEAIKGTDAYRRLRAAIE